MVVLFMLCHYLFIKKTSYHFIIANKEKQVAFSLTN
jgi:hypothetical protein